MSHYETSVPAIVANNPLALKYRRRVLNPRTLGKLGFKERMMKYSGNMLCVGVAVYMVLFMDFGVQQHCFSPIRRYYDQKMLEFFTLSPDDKIELNELGISTS